MCNNLIHLVYTLTHLLDAVPTFPELLNFPGINRTIDIIEEIGIDYLKFGALLLDDTMLTIIPAIKESCLGDIYKTNAGILRRWIQRAGVYDCSWHHMIVTLRNCGREELAQDIADAIGDIS